MQVFTHPAINRLVLFPVVSDKGGTHRLPEIPAVFQARAVHGIQARDLRQPITLDRTPCDMSNPPPEHIVYLSCREIFANAHTQIRRPTVILRRLENFKHLLQPLLANYKLDAIAAVAKHLLEGKIFESPLRAREAFPSLFTGPSAERQAIEAETTKLETAAVKLAAIEDESESNALKEQIAVQDNCKIKNPGNFEHDG